MAAVDLIILGLIKNQPMSAYELAKLGGIYELVRLSKPAIYRNVTLLEEKGLLSGVDRKAGKMPSKRIYSITDKGESHIRETMVSLITGRPNIHFDFNVFILLIDQFPKPEAFRLLRTLQDVLREHLNHLEGQSAMHGMLSLPIKALAEQHIKINKTLLEWLEGFMREYGVYD
ncbi:MAG: PadR family transcriptional regulator [Candidatus Marinimicrobia bacterium]|nr:PadR family transcriptional regulator [Candidatus Neomarinimicrobiota bacterium]